MRKRSLEENGELVIRRDGYLATAGFYGLEQHEQNPGYVYAHANSLAQAGFLDGRLYNSREASRLLTKAANILGESLSLFKPRKADHVRDYLYEEYLHSLVDDDNPENFEKNHDKLMEELHKARLTRVPNSLAETPQKHIVEGDIDRWKSMAQAYRKEAAREKLSEGKGFIGRVWFNFIVDMKKGRIW